LSDSLATSNGPESELFGGPSPQVGPHELARLVESLFSYRFRQKCALSLVGVKESGMERRLAAILVADVVGYSRLIEVDEAGTLAALKTHRTEVLQPIVLKHKGRIVKLIGDGVLLEFASAVSAVQCAMDLQAAMALANEVLPEGKQIVFRIGLNLGEVVVEDDDIFGDGVIVAARLEALCDPGGVCLSESVYRQIRGKTDLSFEDLGEKTLKNIAEPVRAYRALTFSARSQLTPKLPFAPFNNRAEDYRAFASALPQPPEVPSTCGASRNLLG
jgi:adenylate cyclase